MRDHKLQRKCHLSIRPAECKSRTTQLQALARRHMTGVMPNFNALVPAMVRGLAAC